MDSSGSGYGPVAGASEHGNEIVGSIRGGNVLALSQELFFME